MGSSCIPVNTLSYSMRYRNILLQELIKYLVQDGRYDYIETGSLISIKDNVKDIQIPSEEESVQMVPMDFEEWLWAKGGGGRPDHGYDPRTFR